MGYSNVTFSAYTSASLFWFVLSAIFAYHRRQGDAPRALVIASAVNALWLIAYAVHQKTPLFSAFQLLIGETVRYCMWIAALSYILKHFTQREPPNTIRLILFGGCAVALLLVPLSLAFAREQAQPLTIWLGLFLSIIGLIGIEQVYQNTRKNRLVKLLGINLGALFVYDIYLYSHAMIFSGMDSELVQARAVVAIVTALVLTAGAAVLPFKGEQTAAISVSRPIVFYTTSLTVAGGFITVLALGGYYVKLYGGEWGTVVYTLLLFGALITITAAFASQTARQTLSVLISKHLFRHKYDYRTEWLKLIQQLSQPTSARDVHRQAITAVASIFKSPGGALWLRKGPVMAPYFQMNMEQFPPEPIASAFCRTLREDEWVFAPQSTDDTAHSQYNEFLPGWSQKAKDLWIIFPLLIERELIGFMALAKPKVDASLTWEDLDLLKTVGRQVANYLERHRQAEQLIESRQFDAFNKLSAFVMHDLKNLIAQQALVVKNAAKHKDNPAFFEDTIHTINNSVERMHQLLKKLQMHEPEEIRNLAVKDVVIEAVKKCHDSKPVPTLRLEDTGGNITADQDRIVMALIHLIRNAQEATAANGFIDVTLKQENNTACIQIEDNGTGMDQEFVQERLFKPFDTTKTGKGMGIGVYQAREYITSIGGTLEVTSEVDVGTTFSITLVATTY
ncbi:PEP-CTERM system histidine kinase PrsK [Exilibacterium tricleocarpae]|uniref:histidine kinase n=2 Tax=Exilibacterium tricleocarpae TaxID=2591008 RepID=A0A545T3R3_9GAMM|nr:PEP-CTERM system histidine kinase PrsK [Exilibacterium tricleocarpae]